jgi:two-component system, LytTR family, sensor kinase
MAVKYNSSPGFLNPKDLVIRHILILLLAVIFGSIGRLDVPREELYVSIFSHFISIGLIWNGNILLIELLDRNLTWEKHLHQKLLLSGVIALGWPIATYFLFNIYLYPFINGHPCDLSSKENTVYLITSVAITLFINSLFVAIAFFKFWRESIKEKEALKREGISAEFAALKSQINPHFLFNSLNTLISLIEENPKTATDFVQKLSGVYRYVLTQKDKEVVTLSEELQFIGSYIFLNQIRFGTSLQSHIHIEPQFMQRKIVTLALQILVENCIKHNIVSSDRPLIIYIGVYNNKIFVRNNVQPKLGHTDSNGIGLNNIVHRYQLLTSEQVEIVDDGEEFMVSLPLLN